MKPTIQIRCKNNGQTLTAPIGSTLSEVFRDAGIDMKYGPICAKVNNKVEGMHYRLYKPKNVEFLDITSTSGQRAYTRTLFFILCKAVHDLYSPCKVAIDIPVSNGYYVDLDIGHPVTLEDAGNIRKRMQEIIDEAMPIHRHETTTKEAIEMFSILHTFSKVKLLQSTGSLYTTFYDIDEYYDYFYGAILTNTIFHTLRHLCQRSRMITEGFVSGDGDGLIRSPDALGTRTEGTTVRFVIGRDEVIYAVDLIHVMPLAHCITFRNDGVLRLLNGATHSRFQLCALDLTIAMNTIDLSIVIEEH